MWGGSRWFTTETRGQAHYKFASNSSSNSDSDFNSLKLPPSILAHGPLNVWSSRGPFRPKLAPNSPCHSHSQVARLAAPDVITLFGRTFALRMHPSGRICKYKHRYTYIRVRSCRLFHDACHIWLEFEPNPRVLGRVCVVNRRARDLRSEVRSAASSKAAQL